MDRLPMYCPNETAAVLFLNVLDQIIRSDLAGDISILAQRHAAKRSANKCCKYQTTLRTHEQNRIGPKLLLLRKRRFYKWRVRRSLWEQDKQDQRSICAAVNSLDIKNHIPKTKLMILVSNVKTVLFKEFEIWRVIAGWTNKIQSVGSIRELRSKIGQSK